MAARSVLRLVPKGDQLPARPPAPEPVPHKPLFQKWGQLAAPIFPGETRERAAWASFLTRDGERREASDLTDLRVLARAIRTR